MTSEISVDDLQRLLEASRAAAQEDRSAAVGLIVTVTYDRVADPDVDLRYASEHPGLEFVVDNDGPLVLFTCRILQRGSHYRRELLDGRPDLILNDKGGWQFSHRGDSLHVPSDAIPVPHRRRSNELYWPFVLPPVLPDTFVPVTPGIRGTLPSQPVWTFEAEERTEYQILVATVTVNQDTGGLCRFQLHSTATRGDVWTWSALQREADIDPALFRWDGPDRSLAEALRLRDRDQE